MTGALILLALRSMACDACGCLYLGLQPHDRANNFGLWYRMRYLNGDVRTATATSLAKHGDHVTTSSGRAAMTELYMALEARGEYWFGKRFRLMATVPLVNNYQSVDSTMTADIYAVGDPVLMGRYVVHNTLASAASDAMRHRITLGGGVKFPLGRHDLSTAQGERLDHDLQPGTGTWDWLLSIEYLLRKGDWGLGASSVGRVNGASGDGHLMGHGTSSTLEVFRVLWTGPVQWMPSAGAYHEFTMRDRQDGAQVDGTGGSVLFSHLSARLWWRSYGLSIAWQHALAQDNGVAMVPNRERLIAGLSYNLNTN